MLLKKETWRICILANTVASLYHFPRGLDISQYRVARDDSSSPTSVDLCELGPSSTSKFFSGSSFAQKHKSRIF